MAWYNRILPWTHEGRQTWIYILTGLCGPALTGIVMYDMAQIRDWQGVDEVIKLREYAHLAGLNAIALLIIVMAHAGFVSIRALKINIKEGSAEVHTDDDG